MSTTHASHLAADEMIYVCPHCSARVEVHESQLNEVVDCPNPDCGRPFEVSPPKAQLSQHPAGRDEPGVIYKAHGTADVERDLVVVHPAMFRNHPLRFLGLLTLGIGGLVVSVIAGSAGLLVMSALGIVAAVSGLALFGMWFLRTYFETLTVTNRRTIYRQGIIARKTNEVQHDDVRNIQVDQNLIQRILGVGRLAISSSGQDDLEIDVRGLRDPESIAETIRNYQ